MRPVSAHLLLRSRGHRAFGGSVAVAGPVRVLPAVKSGEPEQPYPVKQFFGCADGT
jgi:hypothetical protein